MSREMDLRENWEGIMVAAEAAALVAAAVMIKGGGVGSGEEVRFFMSKEASFRCKW